MRIRTPHLQNRSFNRYGGHGSNWAQQNFSPTKAQLAHLCAIRPTRRPTSASSTDAAASIAAAVPEMTGSHRVHVGCFAMAARILEGLSAWLVQPAGKDAELPTDFRRHATRVIPKHDFPANVDGCSIQAEGRVQAEMCHGYVWLPRGPERFKTCSGSCQVRSAWTADMKTDQRA